jgi:hypothetical protein
MALGNGIKIGMALGAKELVGVILGRKSAPSARVPVALDDGGTWDEGGFVRALGQLKEELDQVAGGDTQGASVFLTLLPPVADARLVHLPPMRRAEVEAVLSRDVARYFLGATRPQVVGVRLPHGARSGAGAQESEPIPVLAGAAPLDLLETVRSGLGMVGWDPASFSVAHGVWLSAASSSGEEKPVGLVAVLGSTAHVLKLRGGDPVTSRQLPATDPEAIAEALGGEKGRVPVFGDSSAFEALRPYLSSARFNPVRDPEGWQGAEESVAARAHRPQLQLVPPTMVRERAGRARRNVRALVVGAVVMVLASFAIQLWGAHRELGAVRARRASISSEVAPLILARDSLNTLRGQVESLTDLSKNSPIWTRPLVELSALLPQDTYLTGFFASGDTVELEAAGAQAGEAIQLLRESGLFEEIRLQGLVERELDEGETVEERFRLWARLPKRAGGEGGS